MSEVPPSLDRRAVLRILDANLNRATEGLRVVEEFCRFVIDDGALSAECKNLRHELIQHFRGADSLELLHARDATDDVGRELPNPSAREDLAGVVRADFKRVEQALRALEEYGQLLGVGDATSKLRYRVYELEKQVDRRCAPKLLASYRLNILIDGGASTEAFVQSTAPLLATGVTMIQLRDKRLQDRELLERARALRSICTGEKCLFIMNDRADLAALADADGVHIGQEELTAADARQIVGPRKLIGVSTHTIEQARQAVRDGADYIGCGPTFPSDTKTFDSFAGVGFLRQIAAEIPVPAFAIGGITLDNLDQVLAAGARRVAVSAAITRGRDPGAATRAFLAKLGHNSEKPG